jgi:hypothetical protein
MDVGIYVQWMRRMRPGKLENIHLQDASKTWRKVWRLKSSHVITFLSRPGWNIAACNAWWIDKVAMMM